MEFLKESFFGNTVKTYAIASGIIALGILGVWVLKKIVIARLKKWSETTETRFDDFLVSLIQKFVVPLAYFAVFYLSLHSLHLNPAMTKALNYLAAIVLTFVGIQGVRTIIHFAIFDLYIRKQKNSASLETQFRGLMPAISTAIWVVGVVFLLDNLGFEISAVIGALGIGGVAVALAASTVLGDLFSYFAIMFDKPFEIGDFVIVGDFLGSVEHIGVKTTRLRSLGGEQLVFSNKDLTDSRIKNYKRMERRRIVFKLGVTYDTPVSKLKELPGVIKGIIEKTEGTTFDRAHFSSYGDFNLVIEVVYYVLTSDYNKYMDIQQEINFQIKEAFEKREVEFAFPTQTLHVAGSSSKEVLVKNSNGASTSKVN